jgi:hypothetical protein
MAKPTDVTLRALWATTKEKIAANIKSSIVQNNALLSEIKDKGGLLEVEDGGRVFNEPAIIGDSQAVGGFRRGQVISTDEQEGIDAFEYAVARYFGTTHIYTDDLAMNSGEGRAVSLLKSKIEQTKESVNNGLDIYLSQTNQLSGASSASDSGSQFGWLGLRDLVPDIATQDVPGSGVDKTTYTKARSRVVSTAIASATAWNTSNAGRAVVQDAYNGASFGINRPNLILMTRTIWDAFQISLQANERFTDSGGSDKKVGYPHLTYMADCRVAWGDNIQAGHFYALNTKFLKFKVLKEANFKMGDFIEAYNVFEEVAKMLIMGQFQISGPKFCSVYTGGAF